jgi:hypothetical protein
LNPVNGLCGIERPVRANRTDRVSAFPPSKVGNLRRISHLVLHCCNTRHAIERESTFEGADRL